MTTQLISTFVFATQIVQSHYFLNPKFQASTHILWQYSLVCVGPGWKPCRQVFLLKGSKLRVHYIPNDFRNSSSTKARPELFYFSLYRPFRPNFFKNRKKERFLSIFIFLFPSDSCQYSTGVQLCFFSFDFLLPPG